MLSLAFYAKIEALKQILYTFWSFESLIQACFLLKVRNMHLSSCLQNDLNFKYDLHKHLNFSSLQLSLIVFLNDDLKHPQAVICFAFELNLMSYLIYIALRNLDLVYYAPSLTLTCAGFV